MGADSAGNSSAGSDQQTRAKAAKAAAEGKQTAAFGFTATRGPAPKPPSTTDGGRVRTTTGTTNARSLSSAERAAMGNDNGGDNGSTQVAKAAADKPAEPTISPEEQEQQRIAAEIRQRRRRVAGYRSLLSPSRQEGLQSTLGGGGTV